MKYWYQTREGAIIQHQNKTVKAGERIFLSSAQAKLHGDAVKKIEVPENPIHSDEEIDRIEE